MSFLNWVLLLLLGLYISLFSISLVIFLPFLAHSL